MPQSNGVVYPNNEFVETDEKFITAIGNSVAQNFFTSGFLGSNGAVLTNKRFYYKGKAYSVGSSLLQKTECIVELSEITAVQITRRDKLFGFIIAALICQVTAFIFFIQLSQYKIISPYGIFFQFWALFFAIAGILSIKKTLCVVFKGGYVSIPIKLTSFSQCKKFLRRTLLARKALLESQMTEKSSRSLKTSV
ncbi:MAG: hypothetical protein K2N56_04490 [Oscillospiraceae bacterium]|nr:hypothetical protein [Oscillospiraceae bacterium]